MSLPRKLLVLPPVAVGVVVLVLFVKARGGPERVDATETAHPVRFVTVQPREVVPRAIAYGTVRPAKTWAAVAEIAGRVVEVSPLLEEGEIVPAGRALIRIDDVDKKLEVARLEAEANSLQAQIDQIDESKTNFEKLLAVERRSLEVARREEGKLADLFERGSIPEKDLDAQRRQALAQEAAVVKLENSLRLLPSDRARLEAQRAATVARGKMAERDVARATITTPFPCRIESVDVEITESVAVGQRLAQAYGVAVAEVEARVAIQQVRHLFSPERRREVVKSFAEAVDWSRLGIQAKVKLKLPGQEFTWEGRFARAAPTLAATTRAAGIVVAVDQPFETARTSAHPPLVKGMFVEVELSGPPLADRIVVPRAAIRAGQVLLAGKDDRLEIRPVVVEFVQGDEAVVASGLAAGERLVVTDLIYAAAGMLLAPVPAAAP